MDCASRLTPAAKSGLLERVTEYGDVPPVQLRVTSVAFGYLHHLVIATAWGVLIGLLVLPLRGAVRVLAAVAAATIYAFCAIRGVPPVFRIGFSVTNNVPSVVPIAVALCVALLGGVWLKATDTRS